MRTQRFVSSVLIAVGSLCAAADAQSCFESAIDVGSSPNNVFLHSAAGDLDGDGDVDLIMATRYPSTITVLLNHGAAGSVTQPSWTFAPGIDYLVGDNTTVIQGLALADVDGDQDLDIGCIFNTLQGPLQMPVGLLINQGNAVFSSTYTPGVATDVLSFAFGDLDGDTDTDIAVTARYMLRIVINQGGTFMPGSMYNWGPGFTEPQAVNLGDLDGDGDLDLTVHVNLPMPLNVMLNQGDATFVAGPSGDLLGYIETTLADFDGDGDLDAAGITGHALEGTLNVSLNQGSGVFGPAVGYALASWPSGVAAGDFDGDGDLDLAASCQGATSPGACFVWHNHGDGSFGGSTTLPIATSTSAVLSSDFDQDGDLDLAMGVWQHAVVARNCLAAGTPFCFGDGTLTACPCGNTSAPGTNAGCLNSFALGAVLRGAGSAELGNDQLVLSGAQMPNETALYFQGTLAANGGTGAVFGDGLRCAAGTVVRLGIQSNSGGASSYPGFGNPSVSSAGAVTSAGDRIYQVWYRNNASFCTPAPYNLTNGLRVAWAP
jgi:hypothetical protein